MNKLHVILDARMIRHSGIGTYLQNLIPRLAPKLHLTLLGTKEAIQTFPWSNEVELINLHSSIYSIREQVELPRRIPPADVFWAPHYNLPLLPVRTKRVLLTIHDVYHLAFYGQLTPFQKFYAKTMIQTGMKKADRVITVSQFSKSEIVKYTSIAPEKIEVIHNGFDSALFNRWNAGAERETKIKRQRLPCSYLLYVGNVKPHKNLRNLLRAFLLIHEKIPDHHLVIVGQTSGFITADRELFRLLEKSTVVKHKVHFMGVVDSLDLAVIYAGAELLVFPSYYEGFGLPPLEAMASGCPVIVSKLGSIEEVCGEAALYVNPDDSTDIALHIIKMINNPSLRQEFILKGLERTKMFDWNTSAEKHFRIIKRLALPPQTV